MPVSTFSHGSTTIRAGARSEIVSRWSSTRERILRDEQRVNNHQIQELDGTGLYERSDWPMRPESVSPPPESGGKANEPMIAVPGSHHITDVAAEREPEAQWVKDDDVELAAAEWSTHEANGNVWPRGRAVLLPVREDEEASHEHIDAVRGYDSGASVSPPPNAEEVLATSTKQRQTHEAKATHTINPTNESLANGSNGSSSPEDAQYNNDSSIHGIATSIEARSQSASAEAELSQLAPEHSQRTSPVADETIETSTLKVRQTSISKDIPTEDSSQRSSTYNPYSTTQVTQNSDRVRYSWQSSNDDEPNRPRINIIKLVSNTATSSAGFPQGEAFGFSISAGGRRIAAYNSARLYILQTVPLPVGISQDFALKRRPLAVEILDDGSFLAILTDEHTVNVWDLSQRSFKRSRTIKLDFSTYCIALSSTGGLLAVAYEGGVEIFSLDPNALPTDRRAVRSQRMDRLSFSQDGSTLLGTTTRINASSSVVVNVPVFPAAPNGVPTSEELKESWCSELLHPENIRNSSHATFMRENRDTCTDRLFAWNGIVDTFGILNTTNLQYGNLDFPVVISPPLSTCGGLGAAIHACPAIDEYGDTVAMIVNDRTIRLYIVPHKAADGEVSVEAHSIDHELDAGYGCPFSDARWVYPDTSGSSRTNDQSHVQGRLLVTSPGGVGDSSLPEDSVHDVEGGRIIMFDFDSQFAGQPGQTFSLTLGKSPPQLLEEPAVDVADEVALVRRRTVNQNRGGSLNSRPVLLGRAATTFNSNRSGARSAGSGPLPRRSNSAMSNNSGYPDAGRCLPDLVETNEAGVPSAAIDEPFLNTAPRSQASLQRAASNAQRHRFQALEERVNERMSGESTATFLTLPEYTAEPNAPLPSRFRAMAGLDAPAQKPRPAVTTKPYAGRSGMSGPTTAPASIAEGFSSEEAYAAAVAAQRANRTGINADTTRPMPRSLQRAYSNAAAAIGTGPPPRLIGDWRNVMPNGQYRLPQDLNQDTNHVAATRTSIDEARDFITPGLSRNNQSRHSTSLLNPPGHQRPDRSVSPMQAAYSQNVASTLPPQQFPNFATNRRLPTHIQAFREAAATSGSGIGSTSLFPAAQSPDHVPHLPLEPISTVPHPVTAWHPPAPSSPAPAPSVPRAHSRANVRNPSSTHSRRTSQNGRTASPPPVKAKKLGFFKRKRKGVDEPGLDGSANEGKTDVLRMLSKKKKEGGGCAVM